MIVGLLLAAGGFGAGVFGSLLGLGGGILIVPLLTVGFGVSFREAVGVSLVCVIVTSSAAAGVYLERHLANLRLGMLLEVFTATGALVGGLVAFALPEQLLAGLFAILLAYTAISMLRRGRAAASPPPATTDELGAADAGAQPPASSLADEIAGPGYRPVRLAAGAGGSLGAGVVSALLGVGGGIVKVPLMHLVMGVPLKVATATSNLMIGVTAAASAIVYLLRGGIDPYVAGPTAVGVFVGAMVGSRLASRIHVDLLRLLFVGVLALTAVQMTLRALS
ncbi:MAG: sulfite exporter TauE/SafE family protein [Chloroflexi bacterium]|nr:sulfite exporter TauE/SafE family protein [Chloroflexota bacterium]